MSAPSLNGLGVEQWLAGQQPAPERAAAAPAPGAPRPSRSRSTGSRWAWWLAGAATGCYLAVVTRASDLNCPPDGEGELYCQLQRGVLRAVMTVLITATVFAVIGRVVARLAERRPLPQAPKPFPEGDDLLWAATHGYSYNDARRIAPGVWRPRWRRG